MKTNGLRGRDFLAETDFTREEIEAVFAGQLCDHLAMSMAVILILLLYSENSRM